MRDDTDDDEYFDHVDMVPETQPINEEAVQLEQHEEVEEVEVPRPQSQRKANKIWTPDEEEALAKAWIKISVDKQVGDRQTREGFLKRVLKHFKTLMPRTEHTKDQLNSKWTPMNASIAAFNGLLPASDQGKWKAQASVSQTQESTGLSKKRKSSESSSAQTPTNETPINVEDFDCDLPNLNENPTPSRQSRGKKKVNSGYSSRSSMRDTLASYTTKSKVYCRRS
ncbi:myb-like domain, Myb/SANT-like DNA-binding domain protein [Artemisia annua]|uniref:Myb-like domain, Myb/SANT-like DNA-binding domain protein n=1 Tax=Artemisia annua TaxID=35608 RepID=A0A2U1LQQ3_ARTAN|nr:myb-like domain, Myb/SANT-like DNA-binding domain protein [Artemisia annua]